jgi:hypothetical protein
VIENIRKRSAARASLLLACMALILPANAAASVHGHHLKHHRAQHVQHGRQGSLGPTGPQGPTGPPGPAGAAGGFNPASVSYVSGTPVTLCPFEGGPSCAVGSSTATCPAGTVVVGGGWDGLSSPPISATVGYNKPIGSTQWEVTMVNDAPIGATFAAVAVCAS